jgi:signal transduction histidine kinase
VKSLFHKLLLSCVLIIFLPVSVAILWSSRTLSELLERRFAEKSKAQAGQVELLLREKRETLTGLVDWISEMPGVKRALEEGNRLGVFQHLLPLVGSVEIDFIEFIDRDGRIFLRVHDPSRHGDRPELAPDVKALLRGMRDDTNYGLEGKDGRLYLRAAQTIENGRILGVVSAGYALSRSFVRKLEQAVGAKVVIAAGDRLYAADKDSRLRPSALAAGKGFVWHREGSAPTLELQLPLVTERGREGTIALFFPAQEMTAAIGGTQRALFAVALLGTLLAFSVSWLLSRRLTRPLQALVRGTEQVAEGNYAEVRIASRDEIGALAASFNRMLEELSRSKSEAERYRQELERKFAETGAELKETEKKRAAMAHMIAHDLKNPLLGINKTLEQLQAHPVELDGEQGKKVLQDLLSAGELVLGMVNEMLDLYRSDYGELPLQLSWFTLDELVQVCRRILGPELEQKNLTVHFDSEPASIRISADKRRLARLLINLLANAIRFSSEGGRIWIAAALQGAPEPQVILRVEDEGAGVREEDLARIFNGPQQRERGGLESGTGLGLPYCKLVAEAHGGRIWARNRAGGGLAVTVALPWAAESQGEYAD